MYQALLEEWKQTEEGKMYFEQAGSFARCSVIDFVKWLENRAVEHSVHRTGKTETIEEAITNAREAHDWAEVSRLETIRDMRDLQ